MDTIGKRIANYRKDKGLTQKELANILNVSDKTISHWERDENTPDISIIPALAEIFSITCDELLIGKNIETPDEKIKKEKLISYLTDKKSTSFKILCICSIGISVLGMAMGFCTYNSFGWDFSLMNNIGVIISIVLIISARIYFINSAKKDITDDGFVYKIKLKAAKVILINLAVLSYSVPDLFSWSILPVGIFISIGVLIAGLIAIKLIYKKSKIKS